MLKQKHDPLSKLGCITTDGARNMVGKYDGMISRLRMLVLDEVGDQTNNFPSIWCVSHRLNLAIRSFEKVDHIKNVIEFAEWLFSRCQAVVYKKWSLKEYHKNASRKSRNHQRRDGVSSEMYSTGC